MNLALGAFIITLLLLPGAIFIRSYTTSITRNKSNIKVSWNDLILQGLIFSIFFHLIALWLLKLCGYRVDIIFLYHLIVSKEETPLIVDNLKFYKYLSGFGWYLITLFFGCLLLAKFFRNILRYAKMTSKVAWFATSNYWWDLLNYDTTNFASSRANPDFILIDAYVDPDIIYSGILVDFNYATDKDALESIVLMSPTKRIVEKRPNEHVISDAVDIPGDTFLISMNKVCNLNIKYIKIDDFNNDKRANITFVYGNESYVLTYEFIQDDDGRIGYHCEFDHELQPVNVYFSDTEGEDDWRINGEKTPFSIALGNTILETI